MPHLCLSIILLLLHGCWRNLTFYYASNDLVWRNYMYIRIVVTGYCSANLSVTRGWDGGNGTQYHLCGIVEALPIAGHVHKWDSTL